MPSRDPNDSAYRRLRYCRYADDWLLGFTGPWQEAEAIKDTIGTFLRQELELELSPAKTLITQGRTQAARFLGYELVEYYRLAFNRHWDRARSTTQSASHRGTRRRTIPLVTHWAASAWHATSHHDPSTTTRHASGTATGQS